MASSAKPRMGVHPSDPTLSTNDPRPGADCHCAVSSSIASEPLLLLPTPSRDAEEAHALAHAQPSPTPTTISTVLPKSSPDLTHLPSTTLPSFPSHDVAQDDPQPEHVVVAERLTTSDLVESHYKNNPLHGRRMSALSLEPVPRQTLMKALASVTRTNKPDALSLNNMLSSHLSADRPHSSTSVSSSQQLADALNELALKSSAPSTALPSLRSPCFYHTRFDDAVDINKVLEEIKNDNYMSHSRLVQTATGVREVSKQLQRRPIRRAVRNVMIVTKARDNDLVYLTRELAMWLLRTPRYGSDVGVNVYVDAKLRHSKRFGAASIVEDDARFPSMLRYWTPDLCWSQPETFDLVCTLGGDGTVLYTSWLFQRVVPPVLSFSLGSLGFLTTFEFEKYKQHLNRVMGDEGMRVNLRMRFTCTVYRNKGPKQEMEEGEQFEVLNELVIDRGPSPYVSNLELFGDNELLTVIQADGCIFSTPTGSTAYSLSAGGSLVHPDIPAILLTPICPHTLSFRPMVLSDTLHLRVSIPHNSRATAYCAFDGKGRIELRQGDHVTITASQYPFPTVMRTGTEWFDSVSRTLQWNTRAATQKAFDGKAGTEADASAKEDEDPEWDIDTDSAYYASEDSSIAASPLRRHASILGM
ncbi:ATP-NAD kinase [Xylariaceae sp. FL0594]|nr:ATP-NAD kinase [Xylariaceae sp. FL0594]